MKLYIHVIFRNFTKILNHENLELYGSPYVFFSIIIHVWQYQCIEVQRVGGRWQLVQAQITPSSSKQRDLYPGSIKLSMASLWASKYLRLLQWVKLHCRPQGHQSELPSRREMAPISQCLGWTPWPTRQNSKSSPFTMNLNVGVWHLKLSPILG